MAWQNNMQKLYTDEDLNNATQQAATAAANGAVEQAAPAIAQQTVSPDNVKKKVGIFKQSVADSLLQVGGA